MGISTLLHSKIHKLTTEFCFFFTYTITKHCNYAILVCRARIRGKAVHRIAVVQALKASMGLGREGVPSSLGRVWGGDCAPPQNFVFNFDFWTLKLLTFFAFWVLFLKFWRLIFAANCCLH